MIVDRLEREDRQREREREREREGGRERERESTTYADLAASFVAASCQTDS